MKVVFVSNFFNHHQKPFSDAMWKLTEGNYTFIETEIMPKERKNLGYEQHINIEYLNSNYIKGEKQSVLQEILDADVVIAGSAPESLLIKRIQQNKLIFRYSERLFRNGHGFMKNILIACKRLVYFKNNKNTYMFCASAYTPLDFSKLGKYIGKCYKWGYFPETRKYNDVDLLFKLKNHREILWCGRFIDLKHPEDVIETARLLKMDGYDFIINMIGIGEKEEKIKNLIKKYSLQDHVNLLGSISSDKVRLYMEKASIFLFTSDSNEGWGAVLNESMNSGCAVVVSDEIGSVPFLINNNENALIYRSRNINELCHKVKYLLDNDKEQIRLGKAAYKTITEQWNAEVASKRLLKLSKSILDGEYCPNLYEIGPCSKAEIIE